MSEAAHVPRFVSIRERVLPEAILQFSDEIDLMDETLREGAERATVAPTLADKCELAEALAAAGLRTLVVGMFPDVPHNITLLQELVKRQEAGRIPRDVRFMVISHVGVTMAQTIDVLERLGVPLRSVWIIAIHSVSDEQMKYLFPTILRKDPAVTWDQDAWVWASDSGRRTYNLKWLDEFLPTLRRFDGGGVMVGFLDAFRADKSHLANAVELAERHGIRQVRLVDTAGTCLTQQLPELVRPLVERFPGLKFYGHFHDDFGMATANALVGLSLGLTGVDVSVGGFANRAGHPALAEVALALRTLYGVELRGFHYDRLFALSRQTERLYGLMENCAQAVTGVITHSIQSGIRTQLIKQSPTIFDVVDPVEIGSELVKMFGIRSGRDGLLRFLRDGELLAEHGLAPTAELADRLYPALEVEWKRRSVAAQQQIQTAIQSYQAALKSSFFTEEEVRAWLASNLSALQTQVA
jgi:homocitrate synthase NifV